MAVERDCVDEKLCRGGAAGSTETAWDYRPPSSIVQSNRCSIDIDNETIFPIFCEYRVMKSTMELDLLRHVTEVSSLAHIYVIKNESVRMKEYQCESLFCCPFYKYQQ